MRHQSDTKQTTPKHKCSGAQDSDCTTGQKFIQHRGRSVISASSLRKMPVYDSDDRYLGVLKDLMIETDRGTVAYAILLFENDKSFALPFNGLKINHEEGAVYVDIRYEVFKAGSGMATAHKSRN